MYAFTFGSLMGDVFFHIFPSINGYYEGNGNKFDFDSQVYVNSFFIGGIVFCYLLEVIINNYFHSHHDHHGMHAEEHENESKAKKDAGSSSAVTIALLGDLFHNFTDGLAVASTFTLSPKLGIVTTVACFVHELPHEIGDFAYLFKHGYSYWQALIYQLITGCGALIGAIVSLAFSKDATIEMVALSGGTFVYMSLCLFMEDLRRARQVGWAIINIGFIALGLFAMYLVAKFE